MTKKNILQFELVQEFLKNTGGEDSTILIHHCLKKKKNITDEYLAKKIGMKVTEIRTILNRLHYRGITFYNKSKDTKTGWYSYTWEIKPQRIAELILEQEKEKVEKLQQTVEFEKNYMFFACKKSHEMLPFEVAAEYEFKCPECGNTLESINNDKRTKEINQKIETIQKEMEEMQKIK